MNGFVLKLFAFFGLGFLVVGGSSLYAQNVERLPSGHIHEAFMTVEASVTLLQAIPEGPPNPLEEQIPPKRDSDAVWVPGYWDWSFEYNTFVWCSGAWRRPPPDHIWITGFWKRMDEGWVRVRGFWSSTPLSRLYHIPKSPPDPYSENPTSKPSDDSFWMPGYWKYENNSYVWYSGQWESADPQWIYVPARYVWRPEGYIFVPPFWDWPIDQRGTAYACVTVPRNQRMIVYDASLIVEPAEIIHDALVCYPDYYYCYFYYYLFHPHWWVGCDWCPPWWAWDWWWFPWGDQWAIWWWWTNPGFPFPLWLPIDALNALFGPPQELVMLMKSVQPPLIVTPHGVVPPSLLIDAVGDGTPVLPQNPTHIQEEAADRVPQGGVRRPGGARVPLRELEANRKPQPHIPPTPPSSATPGMQPSLPTLPPRRVVRPPRKPTIRPRPTPPRPTYPETRPSYPSPQVPETTRPPRGPRPTYPSRPPQWRPPTQQQPPTYPSRPSRPPQWRPPTQQTPTYPSRPSRPSRPPQTPPPTQTPTYPPGSEVTPPSSTYPPSQTRPPSYPSRPDFVPPRQMRPQTPQYQPRPQRQPQLRPYEPQRQRPRPQQPDSSIFY